MISAPSQPGQRRRCWQGAPSLPMGIPHWGTLQPPPYGHWHKDSDLQAGQFLLLEPEAG